jgi:hypothetical protein
MIPASASPLPPVAMPAFPAAQRNTSMPVEITDPFGGDLARYERCLAEITEGIKRLFWGVAQ